MLELVYSKTALQLVSMRNFNDISVCPEDVSTAKRKDHRYRVRPDKMLGSNETYLKRFVNPTTARRDSARRKREAKYKCNQSSDFNQL